jgi:hypothetical protein
MKHPVSSEHSANGRVAVFLMPGLIGATVLAALLLMLLALPRPCFGSWIEGKQARSSGWFSEERTVLGDKQLLHSFSLYDNQSQPLPTDGPPVVLCPANRRFVPLALFDRNPQLRNIIPRPASLEVQMADMIYANLKLKEILDEYQNLRERSQRVLEGLLAPQPEKRVPSLTPSLVELTLTRPNSGIPSISDRLASLGAAQREVGARAAGAAAGGADERVSLQVADASLHTLEQESQELKSIQVKETSGATPAQKLARIDAVLQGSTVSEKLKSAEFTGSRINPNRNSALSDESSELPWIIRFILATVQFIFTYKYEVLATALSVVVFGILVSLIGRPKTKR